MALTQEIIEELKREQRHFFEACAKESDRGLALVSAEFFDAALERLLLARFISGLKRRPKLIKPLFEGFGPLSTFSSKISVSYAFDLLEDWMAADLDVIRRIRNEFAHSFEPKTFGDQEIGGMVGQLASLTEALKSVEGLQERLASKRGEAGDSEETVRIKFTVTCGRIGALLRAKLVVLESEGAAVDEVIRSIKMFREP
jgi:DNA-binding MltR family transcriptional regulator